MYFVDQFVIIRLCLMIRTLGWGLFDYSLTY